jgi:hypothetical protein
MALVHDITGLLHAAQSPDANVRVQAEQGLKTLEAQPASYLLSLTAELASDDKPADTRRLAGLLLKNALDAKETGRKVGKLEANQGVITCTACSLAMLATQHR